MTWTVEERRSWALPPVERVGDEVDLALLDPADPDERSLIIRGEHPEFAAAFDAGWDQIELDGVVMNPNLHLALHEVVANQLWEGEPPEVAETAHRLDLAGYDRHEVFHMIGSVVSQELWEVMHHNRPADREQIRKSLGALPGTWETERLRAGNPDGER